MTEEKRFEIDVDMNTQENAVFLGDKFICFEDDSDELVRHLNTLLKMNKKLKKENNMLKTTIARNESYIQQLTHKGGWKS